jgi:hypothetical protein
MTSTPPDLEQLARDKRWRELETALSQITGQSMLARPSTDLVGLAEIAQVTGRYRQNLHRLLNLSTHTNPPRPLLSLAAAGNIWSATEIAAWPGPTGRWSADYVRTSPVRARKSKPTVVRKPAVARRSQVHVP